MATPHCAWCNKAEIMDEMTIHTWNGTKKEDVVLKYCSDGCKEHIQEYAGFVNRNAKRFLILIILVVIALPVFAVMAAVLRINYLMPFLLGLPTLLLGIILYKYPIATPETNQMFGMQKSISVVKKLGIVVAGASVVIMGLGILFRFNPPS